MDAREARDWLAKKLGDDSIEVIDDENHIYVDSSRKPMTDLEWQKLNMLSGCKFVPDSYDKRFVYSLVWKPIDYPITVKQSIYIEILWQKYRRQHHFELGPPRWIWDYTNQRRSSTTDLYIYSEIGRFDYEFSQAPPYECEPENDEFTITFHEPEEMLFF